MNGSLRDQRVLQFRDGYLLQTWHRHARFTSFTAQTAPKAGTSGYVRLGVRGQLKAEGEQEKAGALFAPLSPVAPGADVTHAGADLLGRPMGDGDLEFGTVVHHPNVPVRLRYGTEDFLLALGRDPVSPADLVAESGYSPDDC